MQKIDYYKHAYTKLVYSEIRVNLRKGEVKQKWKVTNSALPKSTSPSAVNVPSLLLGSHISVTYIVLKMKSFVIVWIYPAAVLIIGYTP